ncbi:hypothetical protein [Altererythrobacter sp. MTPC7]|uniref:hypothetical protein n=1 Tax=Altererythrobacter sp. MTPC7 TaxID=3056567 RepID=UPI0036F2574E
MKNFGLAIVEALITLAITQIPFWVMMVMHALGDKEASFGSSLSAVLRTFSPGDALVYSAGILASSTAYAIMKIGNFKRRPYLMLLLILLPFIAVMFAMPLFIQDSNGAIENLTFANSYVIGVLLFSAALWLHALYQSRAFFEVSGPSSAGSDKIIEELGG